MKKGILLIVAFLISTVCFAIEQQPIFVLIEYNPWAMVIGSDSPSFALYDDGTVIFRKEGEKGYVYYSTRLESLESLSSELLPKEREKFKKHYELSEVTDQPTNVFFWSKKKISVYGNLNWLFEKTLSDETLSKSYEKENELWDQFPKELLKVYKTAKSFDDNKAKRWLPEFTEIMFWPYEYAPDESIIWPKDWPDLEDEKTKKRRHYLYSVYLPSEHYEELIAFLKTMKQKGAVKINGKKMAVSLRFPFPHEELWMK